MKIMIIDRDRMATQFLKQKIEGLGHEIIEEPVKNNALEYLHKETVDAIFFDPAPLNNGRPLILGIRRATQSYPYVAIMSHSFEKKDAILFGANTLLSKPLDGQELEIGIESAVRLKGLVDSMADESTDFPNAKSIIGKSAFNQLFRSALDRSDRYAEESYLIIFSINNMDALRETDGDYAVEFANSKISQHICSLRRQSDILGQIGEYQYVLLLQRPQNQHEPIEAARRFAQSLETACNAAMSGSVCPEIGIDLVHIPTGNSDYKYVSNVQPERSQSRA